ncbi:MAG: DAK2 domain-containing protein [Clostridia bacterium]|nr:DAK2 domain-containing protein [Clostridia bacterium]
MYNVIVDGEMFVNMISLGAATLEEHRTEINDLNVFPIPDGDTGDNMCMTMEAGIASVTGKNTLSIGEAASLISDGMLLGARGNSGVILSRIFAGIAKGLKEHDKADVKALANAFRIGSDEAYLAVPVPVDGTILSVYRDATEYALSRVSENTTLAEYMNDLLTELRSSLSRTPDLLEVLKEAGVVDSGGAGFVYISEGMKKAIDGEVASPSAPAARREAGPDLSAFTEDSVLEFGYCTEFLLRLQTSKVDIDSFDVKELVSLLEGVGGESIVAFREGSIVKVHVHTPHPGDVLDLCQRFGEFLTLKIENMSLQHNEKIEKEKAAPKKARSKYAIVAVAAGEGIKNTFSELGCDRVIDGGRLMNPSAEDFVRAFDEVNADTVFVFPNNSNVFLTATQAAKLYEGCRAVILPTKSVGEGYAAVSMIDLSGDDPDAIAAELDEVIAGVKTGTVSQASKDVTRDGVKIVAGDYIGFSGGVVLTDEKTREDAAAALCDGMGAGDFDIMLLITGETVTEEDGESLRASLASKYKNTEVITIAGGQPIYDLIIVLE